MFRLISFILTINLIMGSHLFSETDQLTVSGFASIRRPADQLNLILGVVTDSRSATEAVSKNNATMQKVLKALEGEGLSPSEYQTDTFNIRPIFSTKPNPPPENWFPTVISYRVTNTLNVTTEKLDIAGRLIDSAVNAGANAIDSVSFNLKNPTADRSEAITQATTRAIADAQTLADAAGIKLGRMTKISLNNAAVQPKMFMMRQAETAIQPGDVEVSASVLIEYQINPQL